MVLLRLRSSFTTVPRALSLAVEGDEPELIETVVGVTKAVVAIAKTDGATAET